MQPLISPKESTQIARLIVGQDVLEAIDGILQRYNATFDTKSLPKEIYASSLLYMVYWFHRLRDPERKKSMEKSIAQYLAIDSKSPVVTSILSNDVLKECAVEFVETESIARKTVDVLIMRLGKKGREFLTLDRAFFPQGIVLPGGLLTDEDENNEAEFPLGIFAALRITAEKVFS